MVERGGQVTQKTMFGFNSIIFIPTSPIHSEVPFILSVTSEAQGPPSCFPDDQPLWSLSLNSALQSKCLKYFDLFISSSKQLLGAADPGMVLGGKKAHEPIQ